MSRRIFLNLPVTDLPRSKAFYEAVGAVNEPRFTDQTAACMAISAEIHVMLLTHDKYRQFTSKPIADAHASSACLICLSADTREEVDGLIARAAAAGGIADPGATQDYGFMYGRSFEDPDGHHFEVMWMDVAGFEAAAQQQQAA